MIPSVCVLEWILHGKTYTREVKAAVFVVMIGVGVCTVTDVNVNLSGFIAAVVAVISTSLQQIVSVAGLHWRCRGMSVVVGDVDGDVCGWSWLRRGSLDDWLCF
jgi:hypothetical protein